MSAPEDSDRLEEALRSSEARLATERADITLFQELSSSLIQERDQQALYEKIIDAAVAIMRSDFASMQIFHPERGKSGELKLLASRGFSPDAMAHWEWVRPDSDCICGRALKHNRRVVEPDMEKSGMLAGTRDQEMYLLAGIRAVQSTPLVSRDGKLMGMLSTHWRKPHIPADRDLRVVDMVARQAAELIERHRAEEQGLKLAAIVETSDDAIISKDLDGMITSWNRGAERLFGYTAREVIGRPITLLIPAEKLDEEPDILRRIRSGERIHHYETVRRRKDGTLLDVSLSVSPLVDRNGKVVGASKIARDITHRKRTERELREANRNKDEFLAMLSHELRNPLAPMQHAVTLLQQAGDEQTRQQAFAILGRQVKHMTRLVEDLLDISRISRGHIDMRMHEVDLLTVIQTAIETSRPLVVAGGHQLEVALPSAPVRVFADRLRLAQVVSNLLNNAAKYTPRGGRIDLSVGVAPEATSISVRDNGIGIAADELPRIFDLFTQLDGGRHRATGGLGVGLALARQLVELHGGTLQARSDGAGQGSEFIVRIPLRPASTSVSVSA